MTNPYKQQQLIDRLTRERNELREENLRLRKGEAGEKLALFEREKQQAILFAIKTIEDYTMRAVREKLAPTFNIPPQAMIIRAFQDCLRLSFHMIDPSRMVALYNALKAANPNPDGSVPSYEQLQAIVADDLLLPAKKLPIDQQPLFDALATIYRKSKTSYPLADFLADIRAAQTASESCADHPATELLQELSEAVDNAIGGSRPQKIILREALVSFFPSRPDTESELVENLDALKETTDAPTA